ncbi:hypothetical protein H5410_049778, partial [Solanum commersonii]
LYSTCVFWFFQVWFGVIRRLSRLTFYIAFGRAGRLFRICNFVALGLRVEPPLLSTALVAF